MTNQSGVDDGIDDQEMTIPTRWRLPRRVCDVGMTAPCSMWK